MARNRNKSKKKKPGHDNVGLAFKVIVVSVCVFFLGYYAMFWVMRGIVSPFMEKEPIKSSSKGATIPQEPVTPTPPTNTERSPQAVTAPISTPVAPTNAPVSPSTNVIPATTQTQPVTAPSVTAQPLWRVHVGHYTNKDEAVVDLSLVREYAPGAFIVNEGDYRIQAGAFQNEEAAQQVAANLRKQGFSAEVIGN